jgi:hypothetical protein
VATNHNISQNQLQSNGNNPPTAVRHESKFTTTDCLNQGHNESTFPGLNVIALQKFDIPYDELAPALQGHVREEAVRRAAPNMLSALKEIRDARDYCAEHGKYPENTLAPDQEFDDWAADVAAAAICKTERGQ